VSDTPRTDEQVRCGTLYGKRGAAFTRNLERELAEVKAERDRLRQENMALKKSALRCSLMFAGILRHGFGPHHKGAIREYLGDPSDEELDSMIRQRITKAKEVRGE